MMSNLLIFILLPEFICIFWVSLEKFSFTMVSVQTSFRSIAGSSEKFRFPMVSVNTRLVSVFLWMQF